MTWIVGACAVGALFIVLFVLRQGLAPAGSGVGVTLGFRKYDALEDLAERLTKSEKERRRLRDAGDAEKATDQYFLAEVVCMDNENALCEVLEQEKERRKLGFESRSLGEIERALREVLAKNERWGSQEERARMLKASVQRDSQKKRESEDKVQHEREKARAWLNTLQSLAGVYTSPDGTQRIELQVGPTTDYHGNSFETQVELQLGAFGVIQEDNFGNPRFPVLTLKVDGRKGFGPVGATGSTEHGACAPKSEIDSAGHGRWSVVLNQEEDVLTFDVPRCEGPRRIIVTWNSNRGGGLVCEGEFLSANK
ncbi:MAG: hypothetical protein IT452_18005 [Planctomycetia bacterium]|nr:hypothetical protein [Planctomycetia bacterium]